MKYIKAGSTFLQKTKDTGKICRLNMKICSESSLYIKEEYKCFLLPFLKLVFTIFYHTFIFWPNNNPSKTMKNVFFFHLKSSFRSKNIQIFVVFSLPFHTFQFQKDRWKWNNLWCHELACINLQMSFLE